LAPPAAGGLWRLLADGPLVGTSSLLSESVAFGAEADRELADEVEILSRRAQLIETVAMVTDVGHQPPAELGTGPLAHDLRGAHVVTAARGEHVYVFGVIRPAVERFARKSRNEAEPDNFAGVVEFI